MKISEIRQVPEYREPETKHDIVQKYRGESLPFEGFDSVVFTVGDKAIKYVVGGKEEHTRKAFSAIAAYLKIIKQNPNNPAFPKIDWANTKVVRAGKDRVLKIEMERLHRLSDMQVNLYWLIHHYAINNQNWQNVVDHLEGRADIEKDPDIEPEDRARMRYWSQMTDEKKKMWANLFETLKNLLQVAKARGYEEDLHDDNLMRRADNSIVVIDPFIKDPRGRLGPDY